MSKPLLYHVPPSFYSQLARLALDETGVEYDSRYVIPGPPAFESYEPWYMRLNPGGTVPTLVDGDRVLADSRDILGHLAERVPEAGIWGSAANRVEIDAWIERLYGVVFRELSYGSPRLRWIGRFVNGKRMKNLRARQRANPDLAAVYAAKIADVEGFSANANTPVHMDRLRAKLTEDLDALEQALAAGPFLAGNRYSIADLVWTVGIARLAMIGVKPLDGRPALAAWYGRVKARPSFRRAGVMERFQFSALRRVLVSKLKARFAGHRNGILTGTKTKAPAQ